MKKILMSAATLAVAGTGLIAASAPSMAATTPAAHVCTTASVTKYAGVTYYMPSYGTAGQGVPGTCTIAYGTTNATTVPALQKGLNGFFKARGVNIVLPGTSYYGPQTQSAIKTLQKMENLPQTGTLDTATDSFLQEPFTWATTP